MVNWRAIILVSYLWIGVLYRTWLYPEETYKAYMVIDQPVLNFTHFIMIMKICCNQYYFQRRSTARTIIFDALRVQFGSFIYPLIFSGYKAINFRNMILQFGLVAVLSYLTNNLYFDVKKCIDRHKLIWSIMMVEYVTFFGCSLVALLNQIEGHFKFQAAITILLMFIEQHLSLGWNWVEDIIFGDMNQSYGLNKGFDVII